MLKSKHPDCDIYVIFDNSRTHHARTPGGLDIKYLKLSDGLAGGLEIVAELAASNTVIKNGWYLNKEGIKVVQKMQYDKKK